MKSNLLSFCFCILIFSKCKKDKFEPEGQYFGYAKAKINGDEVILNKVRAGFYNNNPNSLGLILEKWDGLVLKIDLSFGPMLILDNNNQKIYRGIYGRSDKLTSTYITLTADGDVACDFYYIYEPDSLQNFITLTSFNPQTKEISGTFQATYVIDMNRLKCKPAADDTIRIRNGEFHTKIL